MESSGAQQIETVQKAYGTDDEATVKRWVAEIELYDEEFKDYHDRCEKILQRYKDERKLESTKKAPRLNFLWSNNNVIEPATYSQRAKIEASRRFHDRDPIGRLSCEIIERATTVSLDDDRYDFDGAMIRARQDFSLLSRAVVWERYEPVLVSGQVTDDKTGAPNEKLVWEHTCTEHLHYQDFGHTSGARAWEEVSAVWRIAYMTREELEKRFTSLAPGSKKKTIGADVPLDYCPKRISDKKDESSKYAHFKKAKVYEIWDRSTGKVYWISRQYPKAPLDTREDTLQLRNFFPCPKPAYPMGALTNDSLVPTPEYVQYQDLCNELDTITARIKVITDAIKARGGYEKSLGDLKAMLRGNDGDMVPLDLDKWAGLPGGGDVRKLIMFAPNEMLVAVLQVLYDARERTKALLYEISGNSDMMRGATDPRETATAQQGKMTFINKRLDSRVEEFARFVRDLYRLKAEIICEKFKPETIGSMVGFDPQKSQQDLNIPQIPMEGPVIPGQPPQMMPPQMVFGQAIELMRNDTLRAYRIDIETDSTIALDEQQEKADATEFIGNLGQFFQNMLPIVQATPAFAPVAKSLLMAAVRRYKWGRPMEEELEQAFDQAIGALQQQQGQQAPDPKMVEVEQKGQLAQMQEQGKQMQRDQELALKDKQITQDGILKSEQIQLDREKVMIEASQKQEKMQADIYIQEQKTLADLMGKEQDRRSNQIMQAAEFRGSEQERQHRMRMAERTANQPKA